MSNSNIIDSLDGSLSLETDFFVVQLKNKWPDVQIHFYGAERTYPVLQWRTDTDMFALGNFSKTGIAFQVNSDHDTAQVALWFRSIVPSDYTLTFYTTSLNTAPFELKLDMNEQDIIAATRREFDEDEFQKLIDSIPI